MEESDSDDSIIENTPEKKPTLLMFKKIPLKVPKGQTKESNLLEELIKECERQTLEYTVHETEVQEEKPKAKNMQFKSLNQSLEKPSLVRNMPLNQTVEKCLSTTFNKEDKYIKISKTSYKSNPIYDIQNLSTLVPPIETTNSRTSCQTHVFYTIPEVLKFKPTNFPKNSRMQTIGSLQYPPKSKTFYLKLYDADTYRIVRVKVNINNLLSKPPIDEDIIVFGTLIFEDEDPVIVAMFFQPFSKDYDYGKYIKVMLQLRAMMPLENYKMNSTSGKSEMSELEDYEELEDLLKTVISVSEHEECLHPAINDSNLNEFFNNVSFEKP